MIDQVCNIMPEEMPLCYFIEAIIHKYMKLYDFHEVQTSILQPLNLFTNVLSFSTTYQKEAFFTHGLIELEDEQKYCLRPEWTLTVLNTEIVARAKAEIQKIFYTGPVFHRLPKEHQKQPYRQYHQVGAEIYGSASLVSDVEIILLAVDLVKNMGFNNFCLEINNYGCEDCKKHSCSSEDGSLSKPRAHSKPESKQDLPHLLHFTPVEHRIDSSPILKQSSADPNYLCAQCGKSFQDLKKTLINLGTPFTINSSLQLTFNFYHRLIFKISCSTNETDQITLIQGGRFDYLASSLAHFNLPAVGFTFDVDQMIALLKQRSLPISSRSDFCVGIFAVSENMELLILQINQELHGQDINTTLLENIIPQNQIETTIERYQCQVYLILRADLILSGKLLISYQEQQQEEYLQEKIRLSEILGKIKKIKKNY